MTNKSGATTDALEIIHRRLYAARPDRIKGLEEARANHAIARKIFGLRTSACLTQAQLGRLTGTTASVICHLEDSDYEGHSLAIFRRLAGCCISESRFASCRSGAVHKARAGILPRQYAASAPGTIAVTLTILKPGIATTPARTPARTKDRHKHA